MPVSVPTSNQTLRSRQTFRRARYQSRSGLPLNRGRRVFCQSRVILEHPDQNSTSFYCWKRSKRIHTLFDLKVSVQTEETQIRRYSPFLESASTDGNDSLMPDDWQAVPDIWRSSAEKYEDLVALADPYHDPPSSLTYKQLEKEIMDFSEGLRVIGVQPEEKIALFADNSCRWLVADQGIMATGAINMVRGSRSSVEELLQIYDHSDS